MQFTRRVLLASALSVAFSSAALAKDPKEIVIGTSAGPYADQVRLGIKPILEQQGYKVRIVEFNDYVQPNFALAEGSLDANVFQHIVYLNSFAARHKLAISELIKVPTAPIAIYSSRHKRLDEVKSGASVALPNDPTNQARALVMLDQLGWIKLRAGVDPLRASERDVAANLKGIRLLPLEAAQLPRALQDADYAFVNGNYALASGLKLRDALHTEKISPAYANLVAVKSADRDKPFARAIVAAYQSQAFLDVTNKYFADYARTDYQLALQTSPARGK